MPKYEMIEPGVDPTEEAETSHGIHLSMSNLVLIISGIGLLLVIVFGALSNKPRNTAQANAAQTITMTITASPTITKSPTATITLTNLEGTLESKAPGYYREALITPIASSTPNVITVTRIVDRPYAVVTMQVITVPVLVRETQIVTTTPEQTTTLLPTSTPWVVIVTQPIEVTRIVEVTRVVEVTPTPTETQTTTETPIMLPTFAYP